MTDTLKKILIGMADYFPHEEGETKEEMENMEKMEKLRSAITEVLLNQNQKDKVTMEKICEIIESYDLPDSAINITLIACFVESSRISVIESAMSRMESMRQVREAVALGRLIGLDGKRISINEFNKVIAAFVGQEPKKEELIKVDGTNEWVPMLVHFVELVVQENDFSENEVIPWDKIIDVTQNTCSCKAEGKEKECSKYPFVELLRYLRDEGYLITYSNLTEKEQEEARQERAS